MEAHPHKVVNIDDAMSNGTLKLATLSNSSVHFNYSVISIDVKHEVFDAAYGLARNVIYTGM